MKLCSRRWHDNVSEGKCNDFDGDQMEWWGDLVRSPSPVEVMRSPSQRIWEDEWMGNKFKVINCVHDNYVKAWFHSIFLKWINVHEWKIYKTLCSRIFMIICFNQHLTWLIPIKMSLRNIFHFNSFRVNYVFAVWYWLFSDSIWTRKWVTNCNWK